MVTPATASPSDGTLGAFKMAMVSQMKDLRTDLMASMETRMEVRIDSMETN